MVIDEKRNERFWVKGCGWKKHPTRFHYLAGIKVPSWLTPSGEFSKELPSPSNLSFVGYMLRDALPKVREKYGSNFDEIACYCGGGKDVFTLRFYDIDDITTEAATVPEAMFNAFEKALLGPQEGQEAG